MSNIKKLMMSAAGGEALNVDDVFSTYLYFGNNSTNRTITNGIDLAGAGGLTWIKGRESTYIHELFDTERGATNALQSNSTAAQFTNTSTLKSFNSDGFSLGNNNQVNGNTNKYASWTFRKAPKFFDIVTYTGDGTNNRSIAHSLGSTPGCVIVKRTSATENWNIYHRSLASNKMLTFTSNAQSSSAIAFDPTLMTSTTIGVNSDSSSNASGSTYVAYLFAHNDGDGEFGPNGDQDIIKCGSYTGTGHPSSLSAQQTIELGFEPQWFLTKRTNSGASWQLVDNMRLMSDEYRRVYPDQNATEDYESDGMIPTSTGIRFTGGQPQHNASGGAYIYIAIRRGTKVPESATEVFEPVTWSGNGSSSGYLYQRGSNPIDMAFLNFRTIGSSKYITTRLLGDSNTLQTAHDSAETQQAPVSLDTMTGLYVNSAATWNSSGLTYVSHQWKRAPGFFDVATYIGSGGVTSTNLKSHNLGVAPDMVWVKNRTSGTKWVVWHKGMGASESYTNKLYMHLNETQARATSNYWSYNGLPQMDADYFSLGSTYTDTNSSSHEYVAYLFASLDGISKVGSYTGNGSSQTIDCGFTSGARFVLIKRADSTGHWNVFDTGRGIISGNDPRMEINSNFTPEDTGHDYVDPANSGFTVNYIANDLDDSNINGAHYIFYAVA